MKEILGKVNQHNKSKLPRKLFFDKKYITLETEIAKRFNEFFTEIGPFVARKIHTPSKPFKSFFQKSQHHLTWKISYHKQIKGRLFFPKMDQSIGADETSFNVIKSCFGELSDILRYVFDLSLQTGIFLDALKVVKVTPSIQNWWP